MNDREFAQLLVSVRPNIFKYASILLRGHTADAQDATQQTLLKAWSSRSSFVPTESDRPIKSQIINWTYTILRNLVITQKRHERCIKFVGLSDEALNVHTGIMADANLGFREHVRVIASLSRREQDIIRALACGYRASEMAKLYNLPEGTVKSRTFRVREKLKGLVHV